MVKNLPFLQKIRIKNTKNVKISQNFSQFLLQKYMIFTKSKNFKYKRAYYSKKTLQSAQKWPVFSQKSKSINFSLRTTRWKFIKRKKTVHFEYFFKNFCILKAFSFDILIDNFLNESARANPGPFSPFFAFTNPHLCFHFAKNWRNNAKIESRTPKRAEIQALSTHFKHDFQAFSALFTFKTWGIFSFFTLKS